MVYAILSKNVDFLKYLLDLGAKIDNTSILVALKTGDMDCIKLLKEHGARLDSIDSNACSALHLAIQSGNPEIVEFVLNNAKDLRMHAAYWKNPVHYLAESTNPDIIQMILNHPTTKPFIHEKDYYGHTLLDLAKIHHNDALIKQLEDPQHPAPTPPKIDISQTRILDRLTYFLKVSNEGNPASMPAGGHCNAFAFLFLYYRERGVKDEFFEMLQLISSWEGDLAFLSNQEAVAHFSGPYKNVSDLFQQWVNDLIWFMQHYLEDELKQINPSQKARIEQYGFVKKDEKPFAVEQREIGSNFTDMNESQLREYLEILSSITDLDIEFSGGRHATSLHVDSIKHLDYYDPNQEEALNPFSSTQTLATHILDTKYRQTEQLLENEKMTIAIRYDPTNLAPEASFTQFDVDTYLEYYQKSPNKLTPLHAAIIANDEKSFERLLEFEGVYLDLKNVGNQSALELAVQFNAERFIKIFCDKKPDYVREHPEILTTLFKKKNIAVIDYLLERIKYTQSGGLLNQAVTMGDLVMVDKLLKLNISPNEMGDPGTSHRSYYPILNAIDGNNIEIMNRLMDYGAVLPNNRVSIEKIIMNRAIVKHLIDHYPDKILQLKDENGISFTDLLLGEGYQQEILEYMLLKKLISQAEMEQKNCLHLAAKGWKPEQLQFFISCNLDLNKLDNQGLTPLLVTLKEEWNTRTEMSKILIAAGASVSIPDPVNQGLPLHYALLRASHDSKLIKLLITKSAPVINHQTKNGNTAIHIAVRTQNKDAIELLLKQGANPDLQDKNGKSALDLAKKIDPALYDWMKSHLPDSKTRRVKRMVTYYEALGKKVPEQEKPNPLKKQKPRS